MTGQDNIAPTRTPLNITIVGAGIMGLTTAWPLARRGHRVSLFEQGHVPNSLGSSVDQHRLFRLAYGDHQGYARMAVAAETAWERLWGDLGERLLVPTGTLCIADTAEGQEWIADSLAVGEAVGRPGRRLSRDDIARDFPLYAGTDRSEAASFDSGGGLLAGRIVEMLSHHLNSRGVTVHARNPVMAIDPERAEVTLADRRVIGADLLVVAAGAWVTKLLPDLTPRLVPSRQVISYIRPPADLMAAWEKAPMLIDADDEAGVYMVPPVAGTGMKAGTHRFSLTGDPDLDRDVDADEAYRVLDLARQRLARPDEYSLATALSCFYTVTTDERFVVEPLSRRCWVMSPCSGHGFKFAPVVGELLAAGLIGDLPADEVTRRAAGY